MKWKIQTFGSVNSSEFQRGAPSGWPRVSEQADDDATLTDAEIAAGWIIEDDAAFQSRIAANRAALESWESSVGSEYVLTKGEFFSRLTLAEWGTLKSARESSSEAAYLWDRLTTLDVGITGPPDGATAERAASQQALGLLTQLFGATRAAQLLAK